MSQIFTPKSVEEFNAYTQELFTDIAAYFKQHLVKNFPGAKLYTHRDALMLYRRAEINVYCDGFSQLSEQRRFIIINSYVKKLCKYFRGKPVKAIDHAFENNTTVMFISSKNKHLNNIFSDYFRIEFDVFPLHDKNSFNIIIRFGDYLNQRFIHSFFNSILIRDRQHLSIEGKSELMQMFALEMKQTINIIAKAVRLTQI